MQLKGKQIKDYIIGDVLTQHQSMFLLAGTTTNNKPVSILMVDQSQVDQKSFVGYVNILN